MKPFPRLFLVLALSAAPAAAQNQPIKADSDHAGKIRAAVAASKLPPNMKDAFEKRVNDGMSPKWDHNTRYNLLDKTRSDFENVERSYQRALDVIDHVQKAPNATQKMRLDYTARVVTQINGYLPATYSAMDSPLAKTKSDFDEDLRAIGLIRAFQAKVRADKGPSAAAQYYTDRTEEIITKMGYASTVGNFTTFTSAKHDYDQHMALVVMFDAIGTKVQSDGRADAAFKQNTPPVLAKMREDIGRPGTAGAVGYDNIKSMSEQVERRLVLLHVAAQCEGVINKLPPISPARALLTLRLSHERLLITTWGMPQQTSAERIRNIQDDANVALKG